ncbi:hypothetical protein CTAM01_08600 [Colletotrichum tamarilloi]|uniref:Secreted protein n=1 Tax=Colletotrichum tamarilloi TaxID=1209934 RepID=A0ABQ9R5X1_9PEZI|nr:uncharacterized protein CTAM01_08600 [Colletotrichum tamarilloi]KAK1495471.1 hypothetical protein CTAM01_08600 [Colletotrichum tamarilloi]
MHGTLVFHYHLHVFFCLFLPRFSIKCTILQKTRRGEGLPIPHAPKYLRIPTWKTGRQAPNVRTDPDGVKKGLASCNHNYYHLQHIFSLSHARLEQFRNALSWSTDGIRTSFPVPARCSWAIITLCHFRHRGHHHLHHSDHVHDPDLDLDHFGKAAQPTEAVPTVWSLSAPATAPVLAPAAPNMLIDIIEMPSTGVRMGTHPSDKPRSPMACHSDSIRLRLVRPQRRRC